MASFSLPRQRTRLPGFLYFSGVVIVCLLFASFASGASPKSLFQKGVSCQKKLEGSKKLKKFRDRWEACIQSFEKLVEDFPGSAQVPGSLYRLGNLYSGLYQQSGDPSFIENSIENFHRLKEKYPDSSESKRAEKHLTELSRSAPTATVTNIRHWVYPDYIRLVLDLNRPVTYQTSENKDTEINIRLIPARLSRGAVSKISSLDKKLLNLVTINQNEGEGVLLGVNTRELSKPPHVISLTDPNRFVLDLFGKPAKTGKSAVNPQKGSSTLNADSFSFQIGTIILDPGHGGKDPGAVGKSGLTEKEIVLDIALRLRKLIRENLGKKVLMTRSDDRFVSLDKRTLTANSKKADLFVSIHANSHPKRSTRGVEIYHLGQSTNKRALAVAARENNVSLAAQGSLDKSVRQILFDLGREYNIVESQRLAHLTHISFKDTLQKRFKFRMVDLGVKRAPFYVLLNSNMPSILAEVSFISNPTEEKLLGQKGYRQAIAESLFQGIQKYIKKIEATS